MRDLSILDIAMFMAEFKLAQAAIPKLKKQQPPSTFDLVLVVSDKEEGLFDLIGRPFKNKGKKIDESGDRKLERKERHGDKTLEQKSIRKVIKRSK